VFPSSVINFATLPFPTTLDISFVLGPSLRIVLGLLDGMHFPRALFDGIETDRYDDAHSRARSQRSGMAGEGRSHLAEIEFHRFADAQIRSWRKAS
jgi:hypothetical protein